MTTIYSSSLPWSTSHKPSLDGDRVSILSIVIFFLPHRSTIYLFCFQGGRWHNENYLVPEKTLMKLQGMCAVNTSEGR